METATSTSINRSTQNSGIRRRGPPSKALDTYQPLPSVSAPSPQDTLFTIPQGLRNYLKGVLSHLPFGGASPQPTPIGSHANWGAWLTFPDVGMWLADIGNYIGAAYVFIIAPPFIHDRVEAWDERFKNRLGAFQTWVWAADAALFAYIHPSKTSCSHPKYSASGVPLAVTGVSSSSLVQGFVILLGISGFVYAIFLTFRVGDCNARHFGQFIVCHHYILRAIIYRVSQDRANSMQGTHSLWNVGIMLSLPLTWMAW
jgi:hypothetical protein